MHMRQRVLILGTLPGQAEAIEAAQRLGWQAFACGHREEGPGVSAADGFFLTDIVDVDAVTALAERLGVDFVYSVGSDIAMPTVARVSERLGLPRFHDVPTTDMLHRKDELRAFLNARGLSAVDHRVVRSVEDLVAFESFPVVVKPVDSQGQRGVRIAGSPVDAANALRQALEESPSGTAIIEEWLDGPEVSVHVMVVEGCIRFYLPSDRRTWNGPILGVAQGHVVPSLTLADDDGFALRALIEEVVRELKIGTGPLYFQVKLTPDGPRIIEIASRLDGCHLWRLVEVHTGFDLLSACLGILGGRGWRDPETWSDGRVHELQLMLSSPDRPFRRADHVPDPGERRLFEYHYLDEGELPRSSNGVVERVGYCIVERER
jgi:biotin carboxylase